MLKRIVDQFVAHPIGAFAVLAIAAFLEASGDSFLQAGIYRSSGSTRALSFLLGAALLVLYGFTVNLPHWNFGKLIGVYIVFFFLVAQVIAKVRFNQGPTRGIYTGGALIVAGGLIIAFCNS